MSLQQKAAAHDLYRLGGMEFPDRALNALCTDAVQSVERHQKSGDAAGGDSQRVQCDSVPGGVFPFQWTAGCGRHSVHHVCAHFCNRGVQGSLLRRFWCVDESRCDRDLSGNGRGFG